MYDYILILANRTLRVPEKGSFLFDCEAEAERRQELKVMCDYNTKTGIVHYANRIMSQFRTANGDAGGFSLY